MENRPKCVACNGERYADMTDLSSLNWHDYLMSLIQVLDYKCLLCMLPGESFFDFQTTLHGNTSMLRVAAITPDILKQFLHFLESDDTPTCEDANMILIEDRILTMLLLTNSEEMVTANFVHDAEFETDVPVSFATFLKQRRRWYNGNLISSYKQLLDTPKVLRRAFGFGYWGLISQLAYLSSNMRNIVTMLLLQAVQLEGLYLWGGKYMCLLAALCLLGVLLSSLWLSNQRAAYAIFVFACALSVILVCSNVIFFSYMRKRVETKLKVSHAMSVMDLKAPTEEAMITVLWLFSIGQSFFFVFPFLQKPWVGWRRVKYYAPSLLLTPFLSCLFPITLIYSIANCQDVTWGNRPNLTANTTNQGLEKAKKEKQIAQDYTRYRNKLVVIWVLATLGHFLWFIRSIDPKDPILGDSAIRYTIWVLSF